MVRKSVLLPTLMTGAVNKSLQNNALLELKNGASGRVISSWRGRTWGSSRSFLFLFVQVLIYRHDYLIRQLFRRFVLLDIVNSAAYSVD